MTNWATSARESGRAFSQARDYTAMADWELEQLVSSTVGFLGGTPLEARKESARRYKAKKLSAQWAELERHGFGM